MIATLKYRIARAIYQYNALRFIGVPRRIAMVITAQVFRTP